MEGQKLPAKWIYYILSSRDDTTIYAFVWAHILSLKMLQMNTDWKLECTNGIRIIFSVKIMNFVTVQLLWYQYGFF